MGETRGVATMLGVFTFALLLAAPPSDSELFAVPAGERQLFVDDVDLASTGTLQRVMHTPLKKGTAIAPTLHGSFNGSLQIRNAPLWIESEGVYRFLVCHGGDTEHFVWYRSPTLTGPWVVERPDVFLTSNKSNGSPDLYSVVYDADAPDHTTRYRTMSPSVAGGSWPACTEPGRRCVTGAAVSVDGYTWRAAPDAATYIPSGDEQNLAFDPKEGRYIYTVKRGNSLGRAQALATTTDFFAANWTDLGVVFGADAQDQQMGAAAVAKQLGDDRMYHPYCAPGS